MRTLRRPMFRKGGSANEGIMHGLDRKGYDQGTNWEDIAAAYRKAYSQDTPTYDARNPLTYLEPDYIEKMKEAYTPTKKDWSWLKPKKRKITTSSGEEVWLEGGIPMKKEELVQDPYRAPEFVTMPATEWAKTEKIPPPPEKDDGGLDGISTNDARAIIADKKSMLSDRAKEFAELLSPGAQKRAIYDSLAAASESFGKSTGNTRQDIANAISAAAKGMGGATDTYQKARLLAIEEDIKKGIAEAGTKDRTLGNYEFLVQLKKTDEPTYYELVKNKDTDINRVITLSDKYVADPNAIGKGMGDNFKLKSIEAGDAAKNYGGSLPDKTVKKEVVEDFDKMEKGLIYFNPLDLKFYSLDEKGEPIQVPKPKYLK